MATRVTDGSTACGAELPYQAGQIRARGVPTVVMGLGLSWRVGRQRFRLRGP